MGICEENAAKRMGICVYKNTIDNALRLAGFLI